LSTTLIGITDANGVGTIIDNDGGSQNGISINDMSVDEGAGTATFTVSLVGNVQGGFTVDYATSNNTAIAPGDYTSTDGTLTFAGTNGETKTFTVAIMDDNLIEPTETYGVTLSNLSTTLIGITDANGVGTIIDNDGGEGYGVSINDVTVEESAGIVVFTVVLTGNIQDMLTVQYTTNDGSALQPVDYLTSFGTVIFPAGSLSGDTQLISVSIVDDSISEPSETFTVDLTNLESTGNVNILDNQGVGTILDLDITVSDDVASTQEDKAVMISVLENDSYGSDDLVEISNVTNPTSGLVVINANGTVTYTPNPDFNGVDTFVYTVTVTNPDNTITVGTAIVTITVNSVNDILDDTDSTNEDTSVTTNVLANDSFQGVYGTDYNITATTNPSNGSIVLNSDGTITYTPNLNFNGEDSYIYTVTDSNGDIETATVTIMINPVNDAPIVDSSEIIVAEASAGNLLGLTAPTDVDGDILTITVTGLPALGTVTLANGVPVTVGQILTSAQLEGLLYDAPLDYNSVLDPGDFTYGVNDGTVIVSGSVNIIINLVVKNDTFNAVECTTNGLVGNILSNDLLNGLAVVSSDVSISILSGSHSNIAINTTNGNMVITSGIATGSYVFTYKLCEVEGSGNCDTAVITVNVIDTTPPVIAPLPAESTIDCPATPVFAQATASDVCGGVTLTYEDVEIKGACVGSYSVTRTWTAIDESGNITTASQKIIVRDITPPTAVCKAITVELNAEGTVTITPSMIDGGSSDGCSTVSLSASKLTFTCADVGVNNVTLTVTDACGNTSTCVAAITVVDKVAPTVFCRNITVNLNQNNIATITAADIDNGSFDACGIASYSINVTTFGFEDLGDNAVVLTVTDVNGNVSTCTANVTVGSVLGVAACLTIFNEFSPNDDGVNDYFSIKCVELYPNNKLEVYNRWGNKVYEKHSYNNDWDGTANTGNVVRRNEKLPVGTYYYVFDLGDGTAAFSGWLYIQR
jgi:gliding motility-associated-like protein